MNRDGRVRVSVCGAAVLLISLPLLAQVPATPLAERARGAARVVVATVTETEAALEVNEHGDELIVTRARLRVEEALKGSADAAVITVEGGTLDGVTMRASTLPSLTRGERAVFFLEPGKRGELRPHLRGRGILKLDSHETVPGSSLTLSEIRKAVRAAKQ
jgi:hypothetical protein